MKLGNLINKDLKTKLYHMAIDNEARKLLPKLRQRRHTRRTNYVHGH